MDPISSIDTPLDASDRAALTEVARASIAHAVRAGQPLQVDVDAYSPRLAVPKSCFVTLHLDHELRGCVGSLVPRGPLISEVARTAHSAAFRDPRFAPVGAPEVPRLDIHISVLSTPEPLHFESESDLLRQLRPGVDGVILSDGVHQGTFLPEVWQRFADPSEFLRQLRLKAGLPPEHWSASLRVERYTTESWGGH